MFVFYQLQQENLKLLWFPCLAPLCKVDFSYSLVVGEGLERCKQDLVWAIWAIRGHLKHVLYIPYALYIMYCILHTICPTSYTILHIMYYILCTMLGPSVCKKLLRSIGLDVQSTGLEEVLKLRPQSAAVLEVWYSSGESEIFQKALIREYTLNYDKGPYMI